MLTSASSFKRRGTHMMKYVPILEHGRKARNRFAFLFGGFGEIVPYTERQSQVWSNPLAAIAEFADTAS